MLITLISPYPDITAFGVRTLSAHLKKNGISTRLIFLPDPFGDNIQDGVARYKNSIIDKAVEICKDSDLIGISLMTNFFDGAVQITEKLKTSLDTPVIWGGVHPTIRPEECLEYADMICIGEGEDAFLELAGKMQRGEQYRDTVNIWFKDGDTLLKNDLSPLPSLLDCYPQPDYSMDDHWILYDDAIVPLTHEITRSFLEAGTVANYLGKIGYQTMTSRGCPYNCTYCINHTIKEMYGGKGKLRWRSVDHVIAELEWVINNMPYIDYIWFSDDEFMARRADEIADFCQQYKEKIALPFSCLVSALSVTEQKMAQLVDAGLIYVQMGVESGSVRMQEIFKRKHINNERMMKAIHIINRFKGQMHSPSYDFLLDVPGETDHDKIESLRFIIGIPKPYRLQPFTLILYPGTRLYNVAMEKGIIKDERKEIYNKTYTMHRQNYFNLLITLAKGGSFPAPLLRLLISTPVVFVLNSRIMKPVIRSVYSMLRWLYRRVKSLAL